MNNLSGTINPSFKGQYLEALNLLLTRLKRNNISFRIIKNKTVLDMGCGSGRYSYALKKIGAKKVIGVDKSIKKNINLNGLEFKETSILKLPFKDNLFDFVFCNGKLSHTKNWKIGIKEAYRVLKKNGVFWLSVYGKGKIWEYADKISKKLNKKDKENFKKYLIHRDWDTGKINFLIDSFFSKDRIYFTKKQIKDGLTKQGFINIKFLERGVDKDINEKLFKNPELKQIYGEGEIRLVATKA